MCWLLSSSLFRPSFLLLSTLFCAPRLIPTQCIARLPGLAGFGCFWPMQGTDRRQERRRKLVFLFCFLAPYVSWYWHIMVRDSTLLLSHGSSSTAPAFTSRYPSSCCPSGLRAIINGFYLFVAPGPFSVCWHSLCTVLCKEYLL